MQPVDQDVRDNIIIQNGNIVIAASAGTGKTHTTIDKIVYEVHQGYDFHTFAAITFTKKAAKEIKDRLLGVKHDGFIGTNDNFVLKEVIGQFMYDVYGREFKKELKPDYSTSNQVGDFDSGITKAKDMGLICKYGNNKKNFSFQLALEILKQSTAAKLYLQAKYYRIYIDEYQDSDQDMHEFFMYIQSVLDIPLFIVGDLKQSIYGWRGGYAKGFLSILGNSKFNSYCLKHNFRSTRSVQNYSNMFMDDVRKEVKVETDSQGVCCFAYKRQEYALDKIKKWVDMNQECGFLIRGNEEGKRWAAALQAESFDFTFIPGSPLDYGDLESEHIWVARQLACYLIKEAYSELDFYEEIPNSEGYNFSILRKNLNKVADSIDDINNFEKYCCELYAMLGYECNKKMQDEISILYGVCCDEQYIPTYNSEKYKQVITTIHAAKGLQYKQVIALAENYNLRDEEDLNLHYVAVSRPEERLLVLCDFSKPNGKLYCSELKSNVNKVNGLGNSITLKNIVECINSEEFRA